MRCVAQAGAGRTYSGVRLSEFSYLAWSVSSDQIPLTGHVMHVRIEVVLRFNLMHQGEFTAHFSGVQTLMVDTLSPPDPSALLSVDNEL